MEWRAPASADGRRSRASVLETGGWVAFAIFFCVIQYVLCLQTGRAVVSVQIESSQRGSLKVYWRRMAGAYNEEDAATAPLRQGDHRYDLRVPSLLSIADLRIDPLDGPGKIAIRELTIRQPLLQPFMLDMSSFSDNGLTMQGISAYIPVQGNGVSLTSISNDPWFVVEAGGRIDLLILSVVLVTAVLAGIILKTLLDSNRLRGSVQKGILQVEIPNCQYPHAGEWLEDLAKALPDLRLEHAAERADWRVFRFVFTLHDSAEPAKIADQFHQAYPFVRLHLQMHRSGEVR